MYARRKDSFKLMKLPQNSQPVHGGAFPQTQAYLMLKAVLDHNAPLRVNGDFVI